MRMQREGLDRIYSSPMGRARDTAKYSADALNLPVTVEEWTAALSDLSLKDTAFEGMMAWDVHGEYISGGEAMSLHHNLH